MTDWSERASDPQAAARYQQELGAAFMAIYGNPELSSNPQALYRKFREQGPVVRMGPLLMVNTRELVTAALRQPEVLSSGMASARLGNTRPLIPMQVDPPHHAGYRRVLDPLFSRKALAGLEPYVVELVGRLIDDVVERGCCDFTEEVAVPLPGSVFLRLLGLPDSDRAALVRTKDGIVHPPRHDMAEAERVQQAAGQELYRYFEAAVEAKRAAPADDLLTRLLAVEVDGRPLTRDEVVDVCYVLLLAGLDTVTDTMTLSWTYLARNPEHRARIVADPGLIPHAIEELLRWESPIPGVPRIAVAPTELGGCPVRPGEIVYVSFGSANTDEADLPDADNVRFDRKPNRHLAFGGGIHHCLGSHLAKLQIGAAMREWHRRIPDYEIPPGTELRYTPGLRSIEHLPLTFPPGCGRVAEARTGGN
jgi:cytochrome P450